MSSDEAGGVDDEDIKSFGTLSSVGSVSLPSDLESLGSLGSEFDNLLEDEAGSSAVSISSEEGEQEDETDAEVEAAPRRLKKRGGYKRGFLKYRKRHRSASSNTSAERTEDLGDSLQNVLNAELTDGDTALSCASTLPSEGTTGTEPEEEVVQKKTRRVPGRGKKSIGKKKKHHSSKDSSLTEDPLSLKKSVEEMEGKDNGDLTKKNSAVKDAETSVSPKDFLAASVKSTAPDSASSSNELLSIIAEYLQLTLASPWVVTHADAVIAICKTACPANPYVEKAITWDGHRANFLVHNKKLPPKNIFWQLRNPDPENAGKVADFLTSVSTRFLLYEVCSGIVSHNHLWEKHTNAAEVENFGSPTLRSKTCLLLRFYPGRCSNCQKILTSMIDHERRKRKNPDKTKINLKYLGKEELVKRITRVQNEKKLSQQQVRRLTARIDKLLKEKAEKVDRELSGDFAEVMNANVDKMTPIERLFWQQQSLALSRRNKSKTMRWHPAMIRLALQLRMLSPAAYDFMKGVLSLPSQRRLFDYSQFTNIQEGVQQDLLDQFAEHIQKNCPEEHQQYFNLLFDEMSIRSDLVYDSRSGELIGFTNLSSVEEEMAALESEINGKNHEKKLAKKVILFMLNGAVSNIRFVAAVYTTDDLSAAQLHSRTWDVIYAVEETGAKVLALICDGASVNRKFFNMHANLGTTSFTYVTQNLASGESRKLFFMLDPPHLIKTFRNCFANSFSHRLTRCLRINDENISWKAIEALHEITSNDKFKLTKLTKAHMCV